MHGSDVDPDRIGDFGSAHLLYFRQNEHLALALVQRCEKLEEDTQSLRFLGRSVRSALSSLYFVEIDRVAHLPPLDGPSLVRDHAPENAVKPRPRGLAVELRQPAKDDEKHFL